MNIKSSGYKTGDQASICINGKEYSLNKPGINIVVMDLLTFQVTERASFDTGHDKEASEQLVECIDMIPVGSLVFMAVRGEANYFLSGEYHGLRETVHCDLRNFINLLRYTAIHVHSLTLIIIILCLALIHRCHYQTKNE